MASGETCIRADSLNVAMQKLNLQVPEKPTKRDEMSRLANEKP